MGIGRPPAGGDATAWVLGAFEAAERSVVADMVERAAGAVETVIRQGITTAMNRYNVIRPVSHGAGEGQPAGRRDEGR
jgi:PTH1 family peptidyl-tRNA hydrolase